MSGRRHDPPTIADPAPTTPLHSAPSRMARSLVILSPSTAASGGGLAPIGFRREIMSALRTLNTGPQAEGEDVLYGPGIEIELPPAMDPVPQMLLKLTDEDVGWDVIKAIAQRTHWKMLDPLSGRELRL